MKEELIPSQVAIDMAQHLLKLASGTIKPKFRDDGLCRELSLYCYENNESKIGIMRLVRSYSVVKNLDSLFPIEGNEAKFVANHDKWNIHTIYGVKRMRMCVWVANQLLDGTHYVD